MTWLPEFVRSRDVPQLDLINYNQLQVPFQNDFTIFVQDLLQRFCIILFRRFQKAAVLFLKGIDLEILIKGMV